jgi:hypothetical protein
LLAPDGFSPTDVLVDAAGAAAENMTVTIAGTPPEALGPGVAGSWRASLRISA